MGLFNKKLSDEEKEKEKIFRDVTSLKGQHKNNKKNIKKYQKNLERKYYRLFLLILIISFPLVLAYDVNMALEADVWNPTTIENILDHFGKKMPNTDIGFIDWFLELPLFLIILLTFMMLLFIL